MTLRLLFTLDPTFYTAISSFLPFHDQGCLSEVCKDAKLLVDSANCNDFDLLKLSSIYENCIEQIDQLNGPWREDQEVKDRMQAAIVLVDQDLKSSCKSLAIRDATGALFEVEDKPLSIMERVKIAGLVDQKNAENLLLFFQKMATQIPEAQAFEKTLNTCKTMAEKAQRIRVWMQDNRAVLSCVKNLEEIGGFKFYFKTFSLSMPVEVFLLDGLNQADFYQIIRAALRLNCPGLIRAVEKNPRLLGLPPAWLGKLLEYAAFGGVSHFIHLLMNSKEFSEMPADSLIKTFEMVCQRGNLEVIRAFIKNRRFSEIPNIDTIGQAVIAGVKLESHIFIENLIKDVRFDLIDIDCLKKAIYLAINNQQPTIAITILSTKRAATMQYENLWEVLETAYAREVLYELESFFKSYGRELGPSSQNLSLSLELSASEIETDLRIRFVEMAKSIIFKIKEEHDEMGNDADSETEDELSSKENVEPFVPYGKRYAKDYKMEESLAKRRKSPSPNRHADSD